MSRVTVTNLWTGEEREFEAELEYQSSYCTRYVGELVTIEIIDDRGTVYTSKEVEPTVENDGEEYEEDEIFPFDVATMRVE